MDERHPEALLVERDRGVEVVDGDADVVDPDEHLYSDCRASPSRSMSSDYPSSAAGTQTVRKSASLMGAATHPRSSRILRDGAQLLSSQPLHPELPDLP
jgi:hypothetical protein